MDMSKDDSWYGQLEIYGVAQPKSYRGSVQGIIRQAVTDLMSANIRISQQGVKKFSLSWQNVPFDKKAAERSHSLVPPELEAQWASDPDVLRESENPEEYAKFSAKAPWQDDADFMRFQHYNATRSNYETAMPGEVEELVTTLNFRFANIIWQSPLYGPTRIEDVTTIRKSVR
jgi:hypothetical protein